ncbi:T9SS type A sorting domain-containing protein [Flavobacterium sp. HXWNR69]|uniref:T9SS type A sorting domain-containing protein n=1 Tax=Flavobacterium fragile TaxID=2949085 RepID=A0ABT0TIQ7_9FLAO|nr:T9SS type A sorting domain-containing protein [Flavobacterium sp. HXWNR69]MCL9770703.1 T9SS type A sorting domain-containing protein [Flavobacterium sp. HXWNR69]
MINNYDSVVPQNSSGATFFQKQKAASYSFGNRNWFSFVYTFLMLFSFVFVQGQSAANYTFTYGPSILNSMSGSTPVPGIAAYPADSGASTILPIGFNFTYMGTNYSHFNVNTDGQVRLHTSGSGTAMGNSVSGYSASTVTLAPMGGDNETGTGISYLVTGTAPNRKLIIEWNNFYANWTDPQTSGNMQLVLNEGTGVFEFLYGGIKNSSTASVTKSIFHSSSNTANASAYITVGATPTQNTTATSPTTNSFAASVLIANLANTFYKFTPASTVEAPTALTFSGVTSAGTTINWVDNSTTEYGFLVTRATDAGFTSGVVTSTVASTTAATTGQAYASVQTGLLPSTTYYYKVQALSEAVISADISGSQITNAPGNFVSIVTGNYGTPSTWDINSVPTVYDNIIISAGTTVTVDAVGQAAKNVVVDGTLTYGTTPTSFTIDGNLAVNAGGLVNVFNGTTGKTLTVSGNITNNGVIDISVGATTAGNLTLNGTAVQMVSGTGSFNSSVIRNLIFSNTATVTPNIVWSFNNIKIAYNLNLTGARVDLGANKLIFGNAAAGNTLTAPVGTGFLPGATFARWWSATSTGTSVTAGSDPTNSTSRYPFISSTGVQRAMYISRTGSTTGNVAGELAVTYTDATSMTTGLSVVDGTYTITDRFDGKWTITKDGAYSHAGAHTVVAVANNVFLPSNGNSRLMLANAPLAGTHQNGTITPGAQRVGLTTAQLIAGDIYMGINATDIPFISVANGDWETPSTWNKNAVPTASDVVYIAGGTTVAVNATAAVSNTMIIYAGGTLNVSGSTLGVTTSLTNNGTLNISGGSMSTTTSVTNGASSTITISGTGSLSVGTTITNNGILNANAGNLTVTGGSASGISNTSTGALVVAGGTVTLGPSGGGNRLLSNAGTLTVSSGTLTINGQLSVSNTFNQSGGTIIVDGNAAGVAANSVASSAGSYSYSGSIVYLGTNLLNLTGGTLIVVDPHAGSSTTYDMALAYSGSSVTLGTGHTVQFGDGLSTDAGGHTNGFYNYLWVGSGYLSYGNLAINIEPGTNRFYKSTSTIGVLGNLNIIKGEHQLASTTHVAGNIVNNGVLTATGILSLATWSNAAVTASTNAQTISGSGVFRNLATSPTANLTSLTVNNSNATGVTLNVPLSVSGTLNMTSGIINTTTTNLLTLGTATAAGTLTGTPSATNMVKGPFQRTIASGNSATNYISFPVGKSTYAPIAIAPVTTAVSVVKAEAFDSNTGTLNPSIVNMTTSKRWEAPIVSGTVTGVNVRLFDSGILASSIPVQAASAAGEYTNSFGSVATAAAGASTESNTPLAFPDYTGFLSYADSNVCSGTPTPGNTVASSTVICLGANVNLSLQNSTNGTGVTYQWKSSVDGTLYTTIAGANQATLTVSPTQATYYMCEVTCATGPAMGASIPVQITFTNSVTSTTAGTRCGTGTVQLGATGNSGSTIEWFDAATGGVSLGSGATFTTPSIATTTTYYASATTTSPSNGIIGTGTSTTPLTSQPSAFVNRWSSYRIQTLYTAQELLAAGLAAGTFTSMSYFTTSLGDAATNAGFTVKIGTSSQTSMTSSWVSTTGFTTVYGPVVHTHTASGEQVIPFSTPFIWDGISNVVIDVVYSGANQTNNAETLFSTTSSPMVVHSNTSGMSATTGSTSTTRLNLRLQGVSSCGSVRVPVVATVTPPPALTLSATSATICESESAPVVTVTSTIGDYDSYVWTPALGVSGDQNIGWTFNPAVSTVYTLTATQSSGSLCSTTANFAVTVNPRPEVITIAPASINTCLDTSVALTATGGLERSNAYGATMEVLPSELVVSSNATATLNTSYYAQGSSSVRFNTTNSSATATYSLNQNIDLTGAESAQVVFSHIAAFEGSTNSYDYGFVEYSTDGGTTWTSFAPENYSGSAANTIFNTTAVRFTTRSYADWISTFSSSTSTPGASPATSLWKTETFTIPAAALTSSQFRIRFRYTTDSSTNYYGWLIDDVKVIKSREHITWTPVTNLYTDAAATTAYTAGTSSRTVYFKSNVVAPAVTYTATASTLAGCTRTASTDVTVNALPTVVTVNPTAVCSPATVDLTAAAVTTGSDTGLTFTYWTDASATVALVNPSAVTTSGTYFIKGTNTNGCSAVASVVVTVNPLPVLTITNPATVCSPSTVDLQDAAVTLGSDSGLTLSYWSDSAATIALATPSAVATSGTYYIKAVNANGCEKIMPVTVTINVTSAPTGAATQTFCGSASMANLVVTGTDIKWYSAATGGTEYPSAILANIGLVNGTTYYASQTANGCESTTRLAVTVTLNAVPSAPNAVNQDFCTAPVVAQVQPHGSSFNWYTSATGGSPLLSTDVLTPGTYYVSQLSNGCESTRTAVTISVTPIASPTGASTQNIFGAISSDATIEDINVSGTGIVWYATAQDAADGTNPLAAGTELVNGQTYYAVSVVGTCRSAALAVTVTVTLGAAEFDANALQYYPNPTRDILHITYSDAITHVRVINLLGQVVIDRKEQSPAVQIDLSAYAAGTYVIEIMAQDAVKQIKVVKSE